MPRIKHHSHRLPFATGLAFLLSVLIAPGIMAEPLDPATIWIGLIDIRDGYFIELAQQIEQTTGLPVQVAPRLRERPVNLTLERVTLAALLDVAIPAMGATAVLQPDRTIRLSLLPAPWPGPPVTEDAFLEDYPREAYRLMRTSPEQFSIRLRNLHRLNMVLDYRLPSRPLVMEFRHASVREVLDAACALNEWTWAASGGIVVLIPAGEESLLNFYSPRWTHWTFQHQSLAQIGHQLARDFGIPIRISANAGGIYRNGRFPGVTFGDVIDLMSRQWRMSYAADRGILNILTYRDRTDLPETTSPLPLRFELELVEIPHAVWENEALERAIETSDALDPDRLNELHRDILSLPGVQSSFRKEMTLEHGRSVSQTESFEIPGRDPATLGYHLVYQDLDETFCQLTLRLELVSSTGETVYETPPFQNRLIQIGRPHLYDLTPTSPDRKDGTIKLVFLQGTFLALDGQRRPRLVHLRTGRGPTRRTDLNEKRYFVDFPPENDLDFLPLFQPDPESEPFAELSAEK